MVGGERQDAAGQLLRGAALPPGQQVLHPLVAVPGGDAIGQQHQPAARRQREADGLRLLGGLLQTGGQRAAGVADDSPVLFEIGRRRAVLIQRYRAGGAVDPGQVDGGEAAALPAAQQQRGDAPRTDAAVSDISTPAVNTAASAGYVGSEMSAQRSGTADNMPVSHSRAVASRQRANSAAVSPAASNEARKASDTAVFDAVNEGAKNVSTPSVGTSGSGSAVFGLFAGHGKGERLKALSPFVFEL